MITSWQKAEEVVKNLLLGKITPGSGNGFVKGDVITEDWVFEVKWTSLDYLIVKKEWFTKLERQIKGKKDIGLVLFIQSDAVVYLKETAISDNPLIETSAKNWKLRSKLLTDNFSLIPNLVFNGTLWVPYPLEELKSL